MKASIVIPTYNRKYIIQEALDSVFAQTFRDFELIVVDDASTDNTAELMRAINDPRLRYIQKEKNAGCGAAYNTGIRAAQGEYISFLDSDDLWKPEKLEFEVKFLDRHPEVQAVFSDLEKTDRDKFFPSFMHESPNFSKLIRNMRPGDERVLTQREGYLCLLREVFIKPSSTTFRRGSLLKTNLFDESWPSGNDWKLLLEFSRSFRYGYINRKLAVLRVQNDATHWRHLVRDKTLTTQMLIDEIKAASGDHEAIESVRWGISNLAKQLSWYYLGQGQRTAAAKALFRGFRNAKNPGLLVRSAAALLPGSIRSRTKQLLGRKDEPVLTRSQNPVVQGPKEKSNLGPQPALANRKKT